MTPELLSDYGHAQIKKICAELSAFGVDFDETSREWDQLKFELFHVKKVSDWEHVLLYSIQNKALFPYMAKISEIFYCFCVENAEVERGFSLYNRLKTKLRNRLKVQTIDSLMRIRLNSLSIDDFDYKATVALWYNNSKRCRYMIGDFDV